MISIIFIDLHCFAIFMWPQMRSVRSFSSSCCNQMGCEIGEREQLLLDIHLIDVIHFGSQIRTRDAQGMPSASNVPECSGQ